MVTIFISSCLYTHESAQKGDGDEPACEEKCVLIAECVQAAGGPADGSGSRVKITIERAFMEGWYVLDRFTGSEAVLELKGPYRPGEGQFFAVVAQYLGWRKYHNEGPLGKKIVSSGGRVWKFKAHMRDFICLNLRANNKSLLRLLPSSKRKLSGWLTRGLNQESSSFLRAVLLGERYTLSYRDKEVLRRAGAYHILAISGIHIGLLALILMTTSGALGLSKRVSYPLAIGFLGLYTTLVGGSPSAVRACIMVSIFLGSYCFQRFRSSLNSLAAAAVVILCISPLEIVQPGFLLSFTAVGGILLSNPRVGQPEKSGKNHWIRYGCHLLGGMRISLSAFLSQVPVMVQFFGTLYPVSVISNIVILPIFGIILPLGITFLLLSALNVSIIPVLGPAVDMAVHLLFHCAELFGRLGQINIDRNNLFEVTIAAYTGLLFLSGRSGRRIVMLFLSFSALFVFMRTAAGSKPRISAGIRVVFLDVGEGDCSVIELGSGHCVVIDTGESGSETFRSQLVEYCSTRGFEAIDLLILTHPHDDHFADATELLSGCRVKKVVGISPHWKSEGYGSLLRSLQLAGIPFYSAHSGDTIIVDTALFSFYNPPRGFDCTPTENDYSLVMKCDIDTFSILYTGDAEICAEEEMIHRFGNMLDCDVLKVGHHGSNTSSSAEFLESCSPELAIISSGRADKFRHPSPGILTRFQERGIPVLRTDIHGGIVLEYSGSEPLKVSTSIPVGESRRRGKSSHSIDGFPRKFRVIMRNSFRRMKL